MANNPKFGVSAASNQSLRGAYASEVPSKSSDNPFQSADVAVWSVSGDTYWASPKATEKLPPGFYRCCSSMQGVYLERMEFASDQILRLPDPVCDMLLREFVTFWGSAEKFAARGLSAKRGLILWGPPGSGKTTAVGQMAAHMIDQKHGIVIMAGEPQVTTACLHHVRKIEPTRPLIVVYEDLDALVERYGEAQYLSLLDGEHQIANVVNVATTNYPERLDKRFVDRPGRFDRITFVDMPHEDARRSYFAAKATEVDEVTRERWVKATSGWSIAHLRELIVATQALGDSDDDTIQRLNEMREFISSDSPPEMNGAGVQALVRGAGSKLGFGGR